MNAIKKCGQNIPMIEVSPTKIIGRVRGKIVGLSKSYVQKARLGLLPYSHSFRLLSDQDWMYITSPLHMTILDQMKMSEVENV